MAYESILQFILNITSKTVILGVFIFIAAKQILYWTWLWQLKEYRLDRMLAHLELFPAFKQKILFFSGYYGLKILRLPKLTKKAMMVIGTSSLFYILFLKPVISLSFFDSFFTFLILYLLIPFLVWIFVDAANILTSFEKEKIINRAKEKIKSRPDLLVIGITGSYGKSSTKEILYQILEKKFKALKTPENINTPIGISRIIMDKLENDHKIFIVEMGAYKTGEIDEICKIVPPKIGILTGINEQHLALFGSLRKTTDAKFELIKSLPADGIAILNLDNPNIKEKMKDLTASNYNNKGVKKEEADQVLAVKNIIYYSATAPANIYTDEISAARNELNFKVVFNNEKQDFYASLAGVQNVYNILAASAAAACLGISLAEISEIVKNVASSAKTMAEYTGKNGSFLVADTYNSNPNGVIAALDYLKAYEGKKIIVIGGIIELGRASREIHEKIGRKIAECCNMAILTNPVFARYIKIGAMNQGMAENNIIIEPAKDKIFDILSRYAEKDDVILFSGRDGEKALEKLKK